MQITCEKTENDVERMMPAHTKQSMREWRLVSPLITVWVVGRVGPWIGQRPDLFSHARPLVHLRFAQFYSALVRLLVIFASIRTTVPLSLHKLSPLPSESYCFSTSKCSRSILVVGHGNSRSCSKRPVGVYRIKAYIPKSVGQSYEKKA